MIRRLEITFQFNVANLQKTPQQWALFVIFLGAIAFLAIGCGPGEAAIQATIESQVIIAVQNTVEALPTATSYGTYTPYPTYTPLATMTPYPSLTPFPTYTPLPTFTPSATPASEPTATPLPTQVATQSSSIAQPTVIAQPTTVQVDHKTMVLELLEDTILAIDSYVWAMGPRVVNGQLKWTVICEDIVAIFDRTTNITTLNLSGADASVQNAYNVYLSAIATFSTLTTDLTNECRTAIADGITLELGNARSQGISTPLNGIKDTLNPVIDSLNG